MMKNHGMKIALLLLMIILLGTGCQVPGGESVGTASSVRINQSAFEALLQEREEVVPLDVRSPEEYQSGHIPGAILLPVNRINEIEALVPGKDTPVVVYCRSGSRSAKAARELVRLGYEDVYDLGGINAWRGELQTEAVAA